MQNINVTICACASRSFVDKSNIAVIATAMKGKGYNVNLEPDLCRKVMNLSPDMKEIASGMIMACHTRAVSAHFDWLGLEIGEIIDIRNNSCEDVLLSLGINVNDISDIRNSPEYKSIREEIVSFPVEEGIDAWYPVLDKTKCTECGKCHDFCLFGVYTVVNKRVKVVKPQNCKNNCPACARMCPSKAIIFPKYDKSPINGGLDEEEQFNTQELDDMYRERLRYKLQQRRAGIQLMKNEKK